MTYVVNRSNKFHQTPAYRFVHRSDCPHYDPPRGPWWHGPFDTLREAREWARRTGDPVRLCSACKPGAPQT